MKKNKIYIVTYYKDNYGSFLQCFATYKFLEKMGYQCVVLDCYDRRPLIILKKAIITGLKFIFCPAYLKNYILMHKAGRIDANLIDEQTKLKIDEAISNQFNLEILDEKELKGLNTQDDILAFIAGSDQIWNSSFKVDKFRFLYFVKTNNRISLSISFGNYNIPKYSLSLFKKLLNKFSLISVREERSIKWLGQYFCGDIVRTADPTVIFNCREWLEFAKYDPSVERHPFILVHFLNKPNNVAINNLKQLQAKLKCKICVVGWRHEELIQYDFLSADPFEFLCLLKDAALVLTDSFHTALFSINFSKPFYVYERNYSHGHTQSSRIRDLLHRSSLIDRFIKDNGDINNVHSVINSDVLNKDREEIVSYLTNQVNEALKNGD